MRSGRTLVLAWLLVALGLGVGIRRELKRADEAGVGPERAAGRIERCLTCHAGPEGPGGAHDATAIGCSACHLGNPEAFEKGRAHEGLEREPGALATVRRTCGQAGCHAQEAARVETTLMTTAAGLVAGDRAAFLDDSAGPERLQAVLSREAPSASGDHLRRLCGGCHLGTRRANRDDAIPEQVGSGCGACHVLRGESAGHPPLLAAPTDRQCLGCHSRSSRISLSYQGLAEVRQGQPCEEPAVLHDGRLGCRQPMDVHQAAGLSCIDCHVHTELMGDGVEKAHKAQALEVRCMTCHGPDAPTIPWGAARDRATRVILRRRAKNRPEGAAARSGAPTAEEPARISDHGTPLWNLRKGEAGWELEGKVTGALHAIKATPQDAAHNLAGHERLSCQACHSAWAPTCVSCHVHFEAAGKQWDFGTGREEAGRWVERAERYEARPPVLAVGPEGRIRPAIPGMIMTLKVGRGRPTIQHRRFAVLDPHTTAAGSRTCASCHRAGWALGLGSGALAWGADGPSFKAEFEAEAGLGEDRWTTLEAPTPGSGSQPGVRSLDRVELRRALRVGVCIPCHQTASDPIYGDFAESLQRLGPESRCPQPAWTWLTALATPASPP